MSKKSVLIVSGKGELKVNRSRIPVSVQRANKPQQQQQKQSASSWVPCGAVKQEEEEEDIVDKSDPVQLAKSIFFKCLRNVLPSKLITSNVNRRGNHLVFNDEERTTLDLTEFEKKYVVGFGKAVLPMAEALTPMMTGHIDRCVVSVPWGSRDSKSRFIKVHFGAENNLPDENAFAAAQEIVGLVRECTPDDLLIILISGGGSALLPFPIPPINIEDMRNLNVNLSRAGATSDEIHIVRRRISLVKGGGLVRMCKAKRIVGLIISDVATSPLGTIAAGPTVPSVDNPNEAFNILDKYNLESETAPSVIKVLKSPMLPLHPQDFRKVTNFIIGDNELALEDAALTAEKLGLHPFIITSRMHGDSIDVGCDLGTITEAVAYYLNFHNAGEDIMNKSHMDGLKKIFRANGWPLNIIIPELMEENDKPSIGVCLLFGGESSVKVKGTGMGGPNQELALAAAIRLDISRNLPWVKDKVAILSADTDGVDGPTTAAGAVVEGRTIFTSQLEGLSPTESLRENDSYRYFQAASIGKYHIITGHTETNVMDIIIVIILKKNQVKSRYRRDK